MNSRGLSLFILVFTLHQVAHYVSCTLTLTVPHPVVTVVETENTQMRISPKFMTCSDSGGKIARLEWTTTPNYLCGQCFHVWPMAFEGRYHLYFVPSMGTLDYNRQSTYTIHLTCKDDEGSQKTSTVEVRLMPNTPPVFTNPVSPYVTETVFGSKAIGALLYDVDATDAENDALTYKMSEPTGLFAIAAANGKITVAKDIRLLCEPTVELTVTVEDKHNTPVGPVVVRITFNRYNKKPEVPDDTTVQVPEESAVDTALYVLSATDPDVYPDFSYKMRAVPERGLELYYIDSRSSTQRLRVKEIPDYNVVDLRTVDLFITVHDGFCEGGTQKITVEITDVNEPPRIVPDKREVTVYEGFITIPSPWNMIDPDDNDVHSWSLISGGANKFDVDADSGAVFSMNELDLDPARQSQTYNLQVRVFDKDLRRDFADLKIIVLDRNDQVPVFSSTNYEFNATDCTDVGTILGQVDATDDDSDFQGNNDLIFSGSSLYMAVTADGTVILTSQCPPDGTTNTLNAKVTDQGLYPRALRGVDALVTLTCEPCPTPPPSNETTVSTTEATTTPISTTENATTTTASTDDGFSDASMGWLASGLPAAVLAGVLGAFLLRYLARAYTKWKAARALKQKSKPAPQAKAKKEELILVENKKPPPPAASTAQPAAATPATASSAPSPAASSPPPPPSTTPPAASTPPPPPPPPPPPAASTTPAQSTPSKSSPAPSSTENIEELSQEELARQKAQRQKDLELAEHQKRLNKLYNPYTDKAPIQPCTEEKFSRGVTPSSVKAELEDLD